MSFELQHIAGDNWELVLSDEPGYVHALKMAAESMEPELKTGVWLVVTFPVWSVPARHSVLAAIGCAKDYGGKFQLGIRAFDSHEELYKWWPVTEAPSAAKVLLVVHDESSRREINISTDPASSPIWLVLRDGQVVDQGAGPRNKQQLSELMQATLF